LVWRQSPSSAFLDVTSNDTTNAAEQTIRDIDIHGGCNNWYVEVGNPRSYRIDVGYLAKSGFLRLGPLQCRSPRLALASVIDRRKLVPISIP